MFMFSNNFSEHFYKRKLFSLAISIIKCICCGYQTEVTITPFDSYASCPCFRPGVSHYSSFITLSGQLYGFLHVKAIREDKKVHLNKEKFYLSG